MAFNLSITYAAQLIALNVAITFITVIHASLKATKTMDPDDFKDILNYLETGRYKFFFYLSGPPQTSYQLEMWLPYADKIGIPYFIVTRELGNFRKLSSVTNVPVIYIRRLVDLESLNLPDVTSVFYVNNGMKNSHMRAVYQLQHIQLLHGDSDKPPSYNPVTSMYDYIFVAGQAGIDRYKKFGIDIPDKKFRIVGRPQLADIVPAQSGSKNKVLFYAPTWTGFKQTSNFCSLAQGLGIVSTAVAHGYTVLFRNHPYSLKDPESRKHIHEINAFLQNDRDDSGREHIFGKKMSTLSVYDCMNISTCMIADNSSVISDYLYSEKPFAVTDNMSLYENMLDVIPVSSGGYRLLPDLKNLDDVLTKSFSDDLILPDRISIKEYYLGSSTGEYTLLFTNTAKSIITCQKNS
ncbi:hypothetical protein JCM12856_32160 [Spirochaeta dissipatitropha]